MDLSKILFELSISQNTQTQAKESGLSELFLLLLLKSNFLQ